MIGTSLRQILLLFPYQFRAMEIEACKRNYLAKGRKHVKGWMQHVQALVLDTATPPPR